MSDRNHQASRQARQLSKVPRNMAALRPPPPMECANEYPLCQAKCLAEDKHIPGHVCNPVFNLSNGAVFRDHLAVDWSMPSSIYGRNGLLSDNMLGLSGQGYSPGPSQSASQRPIETPTGLSGADQTKTEDNYKRDSGGTLLHTVSTSSHESASSQTQPQRQAVPLHGHGQTRYLEYLATKASHRQRVRNLRNDFKDDGQDSPTAIIEPLGERYEPRWYSQFAPTRRATKLPAGYAIVSKTSSPEIEPQRNIEYGENARLEETSYDDSVGLTRNEKT